MPPAVPSRPAAPMVLVAVLTYRRLDDLAALLPLLQIQARRAGQVGTAVDLLVVDNDPEAGAAELVSGFDGVRYLHEPRPGIAAARNRALDAALDLTPNHAPNQAPETVGGHDVLVFIDDDERPSEGWLAALLDTFERHPSCGVVGPVVSSFTVPLDAWVSAGGFFTRRRMATGSAVTVAATNNLLLDVRYLRETGIRFDERLGLSGGSDTLFSRSLVASVGPLVWCDEAVVTDVVPAARSTRDWVLRRQLRSGNSWSRTALMLADSPGARLRLRLRLTAMAAIRLAGGPASWLLGIATRSVRHRAVGAKATARGLGILMGAYGFNYVEYRRPAAVAGPRSR